MDDNYSCHNVSCLGYFHICSISGGGYFTENGSKGCISCSHFSRSITIRFDSDGLDYSRESIQFWVIALVSKKRGFILNKLN